jgi:glycerophosphoryl diester phosphodiesterase
MSPRVPSSSWSVSWWRDLPSGARWLPSVWLRPWLIPSCFTGSEVNVRTASRPSAQFLVAHRAGNDVHRLRLVEALGVELVEADVRLFRGRAEVRHLKTMGPLPILWDRWKLGNPFAPRLLLGDLLGGLASTTEIMLDLKGRDVRLSRLVLEALAARGRGAPRVTICARSRGLLEPFRGEAGVRAVLSVGNKRQLREFSRRADAGRLDGVSVHERLLDATTVRQLAEHADVVMVWPVRTVQQARRLLSWGVNGLITDEPEALLGVVRG